MEREMKKGESTKAKGKKKERQWKQLEGGRTKEGGCHPWLPLITHSLMTLFFSPLFPLLFRGRGRVGGLFQPASNQMGSNRVHILQVGPRKLTRCSRTRRDEWIGNNLLVKEPVVFSAPTEATGRQNSFQDYRRLQKRPSDQHLLPQNTYIYHRGVHFHKSGAS